MVEKKPLQAEIYKKLLEIIPQLESISEHAKFVSQGMMDLNIDILSNEPEFKYIALSHYYKCSQSGDMIPDPDMTLKVYHKRQEAEAVSYQDFFIYQEVSRDGSHPNLELQEKLNRFLLQWLNNMLSQGYKLHKSK